MIVIRKGTEPRSLSDYRRAENAYYDGYAEKEDVRKALREEQGGICAYCMRRIREDNTTIEHYIPQSLEPSRALDYRNMLGVCDGNRGSRNKKYMTCDAHRGNERLTVNPLDSATVQLIKYKRDGTICSDDETIEPDLDIILNLNCDCAEVRLKSNRKAALEAFQKQLWKKKQRGIWSKEFLIKKKNELMELLNKKEYVGIMLDDINKRLKRQQI